MNLTFLKRGRASYSILSCTYIRLLLILPMRKETWKGCEGPSEFPDTKCSKWELIFRSVHSIAKRSKNKTIQGCITCMHQNVGLQCWAM